MDGMRNVMDPNEFLREFRKACATPVTLLRQTAQAMATEMQEGLENPGQRRLKMLPTYLECLPSGNEKGLYYAVDLGGTNFRVLRVQLGGKDGRILKQESEQVPIPHEVMTGTSKALFDFLAETVIHFISKEATLGFECLNLNQQRDIGFTFSFPVNQTKVNQGAIVAWTKGFNITDSVGEDVVEQLQSALAEMGSEHAKVACLVNDTVGTLAQCKYWNQDAMVGVILGTGTNACYVERADAVPCWSPSTKSDMTVINVEWGNFFSKNLPWTFADEGLDKDSLNPGRQEFEKMIGGMYMGEIVRRVLLKMAEETGLFGPEVPEKLTESFSLLTPHMSTMHGDDSPGLQVVGAIIAEAIGVKDTTLATRKVVYEVCDIIAERGARLSAAGIVGILKKINRCGDLMNSCLTGQSNTQAKKTVVAIDGSLYEKYTKFRNYMEDAMKEMLGDDYADNVTTMLSKDGSGVGAALLAAAMSTDQGLGVVGLTK
ncbi:hypothetical protein M758_9G156600 [Ceratodon purpureus]|nr:hypothetical protein M758_9G156600 [Ceratodon purpureus]